MPEISVIVPVYNVENKIRRCVDSILAQTFTDFELLLVDDGSTDGSGDICDDYSEQDDRIKTIRQDNGGVSCARNTGIKASIGKYISFIDSDDYVEPDYLMVLYQGIKIAQLSICGVYYCRDGIEEKSAQKEFNDFSLRLHDSTDLLAELLRDRRFNYVYSKLYLRKIIIDNDILFDVDITLGEDTVFVMDYLCHISSVYIIGKAYYNYIRYDGNTLTTQFREDSYKQYTYINDYIEKTFLRIGVLDSVLTKEIDKRRLDSAVWSIDSIMHNAEISKEKKKDHLSVVFGSESLMAAIDRNPDITADSRYYQIIRSQSAESFIRYYSGCQRKQRMMLRFRIIVVKLFPHELIKRVKKCLRIAQ